MSCIELIAGLGNPGAKYEQTRHNVGFWLVETLAASKGASFKHEAKFHGDVAKLSIDNHLVYIIKPTTYMNKSGQAVATLARFYKINPENILVVHDELDLPCGSLRLKKGGGAGGHNGLRDIIEKTGSRDFTRLRIGIGHPGESSKVTNHVLGRVSSEDEATLNHAIDEALHYLPQVVQGELQKAMNHLHTIK